MKLVAVLVALIQLFIVYGGQAASDEIEYIYIEQYEDFEANLRLANELMGYAPGYLAAKVPAYDGSVSSSVSIGASFDESGDKRAYVWIRYDYSNPNLVSKKDDLNRELRSFFTEQAEAHVNMSPIFNWRGPLRANWIEDVYSGLGPLSYDSLVSSIKARLLLEEWEESCNRRKLEFGPPLDISFYGGQTYEGIDSMPDYITLLYSADFEKGKKLRIFIREALESGEWKIVGSEVFPWEEE